MLKVCIQGSVLLQIACIFHNNDWQCSDTLTPRMSHTSFLYVYSMLTMLKEKKKQNNFSKLISPINSYTNFVLSKNNHGYCMKVTNKLKSMLDFMRNHAQKPFQCSCHPYVSDAFGEHKLLLGMHCRYCRDCCYCACCVQPNFSRYWKIMW